MPQIACSCCPPAAGSQPGRRRIAFGLASLAAATLLPRSAAQAADPVPRTPMTPEQALQALQDGNKAFQAGAPFNGAHGPEIRVALSVGQAPFCVIVGCSDSRVSPELLFGRGLGELFVVRNAGNTVDTAALGSIEYGVAELGVPLIVVMGHQSCGAVAAALEMVRTNATFPGVIGEMIQPILPAVLDARGQPGDPLDNAVRSNARRVAGRLRTQSPVLIEAMAKRQLKIVAAHYDLQSGHVDWLDAA